MKKITVLLTLLLSVLGVKADVEWTIWEGESSSENNYTPLFSIPQSIITSLDTGDIIYATFTKKNETNDGNWRIDWNSVQHISGFDYTNNTISLPVTDELKSQVGGSSSYMKYEWNSTTNTWDASSVTQAGDLKIQGSSFTLTKVAIRKKTSMIKKSVWTGAHNIVYWNGLSLEAGSFSGIVNNDFIYAKASRHTAAVTYTDGESNAHTDETPTYWILQLQDWGSDDKFSSINIPLYEAATGTWTAISSDADKVASHSIGATGFCCDLSELDYYHPVTSFSIGSIGLATFCANTEVTVPNGIEAYTATVSGSAVTLTKIESGVIPANTGVIIKGDEGAVVEFTATSTGSSATSDLTGVTTATTMTAGDYVLYNNGGTAEFRRVTATELAANKAYLSASKINESAPVLTINFGSNTTGIEEAAKSEEVKVKGYFDLQGRRVAQPTKGLYIVNGKKVIIK